MAHFRRRSMKKTFYEFLGIDPDASAEAVEAAYRQRLDELNRRPVQDAGARLAVREAYFSLSHPNRRAAYDALLKQPVGRVAADRNESARAASTWTAFCRWIVAAAVLLGAGAWWGRHHTAPLPGAKVAAVRPVEPPVAQVPAAPAPPVEMPQAETTAAAPVGVRSAEDIFALASASIARVNVLDASGRAVGSGSAVVIEPATLITNCHVALRGAGLNVRIGAETLPANIAVADEELDLCRLHVPGLRAPAVKMAKVSELRTGVRVYAIGAPAGLELTLSEGIVSALRE